MNTKYKLVMPAGWLVSSSSALQLVTLVASPSVTAGEWSPTVLAYSRWTLALQYHPWSIQFHFKGIHVSTLKCKCSIVQNLGIHVRCGIQTYSKWGGQGIHNQYSYLLFICMCYSCKYTYTCIHKGLNYSSKLLCIHEYFTNTFWIQSCWCEYIRALPKYKNIH